MPYSGIEHLTVRMADLGVMIRKYDPMLDGIVAFYKNKAGEDKKVKLPHPIRGVINDEWMKRVQAMFE